VDLCGLPAPAGLGASPVKSPQQQSQSKSHETEIYSEKTKHQVSRETEKVMIAVKIVFLQELVLHTQQRCHSARRAAPFPVLRAVPPATGHRERARSDRSQGGRPIPAPLLQKGHFIVSKTQ